MSPVRDHRLVVETVADREARGHPVGQATPYVAMGGITGFSSLAEGYMRLDPSGRGQLSTASTPFSLYILPYMFLVWYRPLHKLTTDLKSCSFDHHNILTLFQFCKFLSIIL